MALKKEIIFENGVNIKYHKIDDVNLDNKEKKIKIKIVSYTDETYRNLEIENKNKQYRYEELMELILSENEKNEEERDVEQVKEWSDEANELVGKFKNELNLSVVSTEVEFKDIFDISLNNLYKLLKELDLFKDSEDI